MSEAKIEKLLADHKDEIKRHFSMVAESLEDKIKIVSEQVGANTEKLYEHDDRFNNQDEAIEYIKLQLQNHTQRFNNLDEAIEYIKAELKKTQSEQKTDRKEIKEVIKFKKRLGLFKTESTGISQ